MVLVTAVLMTMALSSGIAAADDQTSHVEAQPVPSITLNMTGGSFYNLSFMGLILKTANGALSANFNQGKWNFTSGNNGSYSYSSTVRFVPNNSQGGSQDSVAYVGFDGSEGNGGQGNNNTGGTPNGNSNNAINANVVISMKALDYSLSNVSVGNSSAVSGNYSFPQYSMLEITISVVFQNPVKGPGHLELIQLIKSPEEGNGSARYYFGKIAHDHSDKVSGDNQGVRIPSRSNVTMNGTLNAFYWWNSTYNLNGVSHNLSSSVTLKDGGVYILFDFAFNSSTSLKSIYQDPYIGIPGQPVFKNPIIKKVVGKIVNYLVINAEYFASGLASGVILLGVSYSFYRRRRF